MIDFTVFYLERNWQLLYNMRNECLLMFIKKCEFVKNG